MKKIKKVLGLGLLAIFLLAAMVTNSSAQELFTLKWKFQTRGWVYSSPALGDVDGDGKIEVVVGSQDNNLYVFSGTTGALKWKFQTGFWVDSSPTLGDVDGDGRVEVIVVSGDGHIYVFDGANGYVKWKKSRSISSFLYPLSRRH